MADLKKKVVENVDGGFFVDSTCINCDTCRQLAPLSFRDAGEHSFVYRQPQSGGEEEACLRALLACPTGSIGSPEKMLDEKKKALLQFPLSIEDDVFYCGFNSPKSYGANSFFIKRDDGNWLIDSPKYLPQLVLQFEACGGLKYIFLTHRDDVADADKYAQHFKAKRIIHEADLDSQPDSEVVISQSKVVDFAEHFKIIPVPGHTEGHMVLLYKEKFLFTGDHLCYDEETGSLSAFRRHCWYSWKEQIKSMKTLLEPDINFSWVLAGHGNRHKLTPPTMREKLKELVEWMEQS